MKKKGYFCILCLSGVIFLGCIFAFLKNRHYQNLSEQEITTIDFIASEAFYSADALSQQEITTIDFIEQEKQSMPELVDNFTEVEEGTKPIVSEQMEAEMDSLTGENIDLSISESAESETVVENVQKAFYSTPLTEELKAYITGKSYPDTTEPIQISYDALAYVHILHYDFEGQVQEGELICNQAIAQDLVDIFRTLYEQQYAIEKVRLIDEYGADDELSIADNNTSCFNYRTVPGKSKLSNHSYGYAIDINPLYNPYVRTRNGTELISPENGADYADRSVDFLHKIDRKDLCYQLFIEHGFEWGGAWNSSKDYQHFEKTKDH